MAWDLFASSTWAATDEAVEFWLDIDTSNRIQGIRVVVPPGRYADVSVRKNQNNVITIRFPLTGKAATRLEETRPFPAQTLAGLEWRCEMG